MPSDYEAAAEFLGREDFTDEEMAFKTPFRKKLQEIFKRDGHASPTENQIDSFFGLVDIKEVSFPEVGIRTINVNFKSGVQQRFAIPNQKGLFGFNKALEFFSKLSVR